MVHVFLTFTSNEIKDSLYFFIDLCDFVYYCDNDGFYYD